MEIVVDSEVATAVASEVETEVASEDAVIDLL